ncbi:hypothetical protein K7432_012708 [Basidiobolus ranarum]|uniref:Uncharacterized protein n=1 Tax=Basidiobolus ranarum TaxID=34480 RepID=A0ABR2WKG9_9FUNG
MDCLLKHCSQLKSLSIELTYFDNHRPLPVEKLCHDIARAYEGQLTELKLKFHRKPLIPEAITNLIWENHGSHLTSLDLSGYPITNASLIFLGQSVSSNLKHLNLSKCLEGGLPSLSAFSTLLSTCGGGLRTLQLDSNDQVDDSVAMIIATHCHGLRKLSLRKTTTSNVGLKKILETNGYSLRVLYVSELSVPQGAFKEITHFCPYLVELDAGWSGTLESPQERVIIDEFSEFMRLRGHRIEILTVDGWPNICHVLTIIVTYERTLSQITLSDDEKLSDQYLRDVLQPCKKLHRVHILLPFPYQAEGLSDDALVETAGKNYEQGSEMDQPRTYTFDMRR